MQYPKLLAIALLPFLNIVLGAAIASPNGSGDLPGNSWFSTKLCDGDKVNSALLKTFTLQNPPSEALLKTCDSLLFKTRTDLDASNLNSTELQPPSSETPADGPTALSHKQLSCYGPHRARKLDVLVTVLHLFADGNSRGIARESSVYRWGNARILAVYDGVGFRDRYETKRYVGELALYVSDRCNPGGNTVEGMVLERAKDNLRDYVDLETLYGFL